MGALTRFNMVDCQNPNDAKKRLTPEAQRALAEAAARRAEQEVLPPEGGGPAGPEPTRYGDWERNGIAVDF